MNEDEAQEAVMYIADQALLELGKQAFQALVDESGFVDTLSAMKPYKNRNAYILLCMVKKKLHLMGTSIDKLIIPMALAQAALSGPENVHQEIRERGAVCRVDNCPYQGASPEHCIVISHTLTALICDAINPEYEAIWTHHLTNGDHYCRYIYRKKSEPNKDTDDLGELVATLPMMEIPPDDAATVRNFILANWLDAVTEAFVDLHGSEKALSILTPIAKNIGVEAGKWLVARNEGVENDAAAMGGMVDLFGKAIKQQGRVQRSSKDEMNKEVTDCPFQIFPYEECKQIEAIFQGVIQTMNPDLEFAYDSMIPHGDETCRWHVRAVGAKPLVFEQEPPEAVDPLALLKVRLAKGEISKAEFEEIKILISSR